MIEKNDKKLDHKKQMQRSDKESEVDSSNEIPPETTKTRKGRAGILKKLVKKTEEHPVPGKEDGKDTVISEAKARSGDNNNDDAPADGGSQVPSSAEDTGELMPLVEQIALESSSTRINIASEAALAIEEAPEPVPHIENEIEAASAVEETPEPVPHIESLSEIRPAVRVHQMGDELPDPTVTDTIVDADCVKDGSPTAEHRNGDVLFGKYRISEVILSDDVSTIYRGRDLSKDRRVMIEAVNIPVQWQAGVFTKSAGESIVLNHPHILKPLAFEESVKEKPYFISEYIPFIRLNDLIETSGFIEQELEAVETLIQVCQALKQAHELGVVHGYLHPRNVFLIEEDGAIKVKLGGFGFCGAQKQLRVGGATASETQDFLTPQVDIFQLSQLTYYLLTGHVPCKNHSVQEAFELLTEVKVDFTALAELRPDLCGREELLQLLEDAIDPDEEWRVKTAQEFEDGLNDWLEAVKKAKATQSAMAEKVAENREKQDRSPSVKKKRKITNNMKTTVKRLVNLRINQSNQEETAVMRLTDLAAAHGPRRSPLVSAVRLLIVVLVVVGVMAIAVYALVFKPDETRELWDSAAQRVAGIIPKKRVAAEETPVDVKPVSKQSTTAKNKQTKVVVAKAEPKRENKLPPFNPALLRNYYRADFQPNNTERRRFRIEYRAFNRDWLK